MDIFGKNPYDYQHIADLMDLDKFKAHDAACRIAYGQGHNFDALKVRDASKFNDVEAAAQGIGFVTNNLQAIRAQVEEILYTETRYTEMVPIVTNIPEGAKSYSYRVVDHFGSGKFIDADGGNVATAATSLRNVPYILNYGGIAAKWSLEDLRAAAFGGVALDSEELKAATEGAIDHIEQVCFTGDSARSIEGLVNSTAVTATGSAKAISAMTADEMVAFIQTGVVGIIENSNEIFGRNLRMGDFVIYAPISQADKLLTTKLSTNADKSVWDYAMTNNAWTRLYSNSPLSLKPLQELTGAGDGSTDRIIFALKHERVYEFAVPFGPRMANTVPQLFGVEAGMEYKISGLNIKRPAGMRYYDEV